MRIGLHHVTEPILETCSVIVLFTYFSLNTVNLRILCLRYIAIQAISVRALTSISGCQLRTSIYSPIDTLRAYVFIQCIWTRLSHTDLCLFAVIVSMYYFLMSTVVIVSLQISRLLNKGRFCHVGNEDFELGFCCYAGLMWRAPQCSSHVCFCRVEMLARCHSTQVSIVDASTTKNSRCKN